jgi:imidazolonepropionase-like amidohydrolase
MICPTYSALRRPPILLIFSCAFGLAQAQTPEQESDSLYKETYAIVGARIEAARGKLIEKGTVIIRNGRIQAVGADIKVPSYAFVIKGDKLTVYPGFIDAYTTKGLKLPEQVADQDVKPDEGQTPPASMREANRKGVRPELNAADFLDLSGMEAERKAGITCELIAPSGGILNGSAALVQTSGRPARESILRPTFGLCIGFSASGPGYPATPLGYMAHLRQTLLDAQRAAHPSYVHEAGAIDRPLLALQPALQGKIPTLMECDRNFEIARCLGVADQFDLKPIIVGGLDAHTQIDEIKKRGIPVLLSMNFAPEPSPAKKPEEKPATPVGTPPPGTPPSTPPANPAENPGPVVEDAEVIPPDVQAERQGKWLDRVKTAKALAAASIPFSFSSRGTRDRDQFWKNLRRVIAEGLDRQTALDALTINPAKLFGVDKELGTVEAGKLANLTIMDGDFAKDNSKMMYLFSGGRFFDLTKKPAAAQPPRRRFGGDEDPHGNGMGGVK